MGNERSKWLKIVLVVSLCLNLFLLSAGAVILLKGKKMKTSRGRIEYVAKFLKLTKEQKIELWQLTRPLRQNRREMRQEHMQEINELSAELSKNDPDYEKINQIIGKIAEARGKFLGFAAEQLEPFLKDLTLEQRQIIAKKIESLKNRPINELE